VSVRLSECQTLRPTPYASDTTSQSRALITCTRTKAAATSTKNCLVVLIFASRPQAMVMVTQQVISLSRLKWQFLLCSSVCPPFPAFSHPPSAIYQHTARAVERGIESKNGAFCAENGASCIHAMLVTCEFWGASRVWMPWAEFLTSFPPCCCAVDYRIRPGQESEAPHARRGEALSPKP
jgi:hypothetical protein